MTVPILAGCHASVTIAFPATDKAASSCKGPPMDKKHRKAVARKARVAEKGRRRADQDRCRLGLSFRFETNYGRGNLLRLSAEWSQK